MENSETIIKKDIHQVSTKWKGNMHFESTVNNHIIHMDKLAQHGGTDTGPRPKPLLLSAVAGCIGMEIAGILEKMRLKIETLDIDVTGELTNDHPKMYKEVNIIFNLKCDSNDQVKINKAIYLAVDKYCGVVAMFRQFATVTMEINYL